MDILKISGLFCGTPGYALTRHLYGIRRAAFAYNSACFSRRKPIYWGKGESNEEEILSVL